MILDKNNVLIDFNDTVYSAVMIPDVRDYNGDCFTANEIRDKMEDYMVKYRNIDKNHNLENINDEVCIIENFISPVPITIKDKTFPTGTWFMGLKIFNEEIKEDIKNGKLKGLSASAMSKSKLRTFLAHKSKEIEKRTFKELGEDFEIFGVSLVEDPSYEDALFYSFKEKTKDIPEENHIDMKQDKKKDKDILSIKDKIKDVLIDESGISKKQKEVKEEMTKEDFLKLVEDNIDSISEMISNKQKAEEKEIVKDEVKEDIKEKAEDTDKPEDKEEVKDEDKKEDKDKDKKEDIKDTNEEISNKEKDLELKINELNDKIKTLEEENLSFKNKSTQPDNINTEKKIDSGFDIFGRRKK